MAAPKRPGDTPKKPFVGTADRPEVRLDLDKPVNELRVRDLAAILGHVIQKSPFFEVGKTPIKDFFDKHLLGKDVTLSAEAIKAN